MLFRRRKSKKQLETQWDEGKWQYEEAICRCYKWNRVTLALCGADRFVGFNTDYGNISLVEGKRPSLVDDSFRMYGVVHEDGHLLRHIPCNVDLTTQERSEDAVGSITLTHTGSERRPEERELQLDVILYDSSSDLRKYLLDSLRDASLSGYQFMHVSLGFLETSEEEVKIAMAHMYERAYGPTRRIVDIKLWPSIELPKAPSWARRKE